jgi:hypothetical protein
VTTANTKLLPFVVVLSDRNGEQWFFSVQGEDPAAAVRAAFDQLVAPDCSEAKRDELAREMAVDHLFPGEIGNDIGGLETCADAFREAV